jgi:hypothetical protein
MASKERKMTLRVYGAEVKEILETDLSNSVIETFILAANLTVTELLGSNTDISDAQRTEIERWLAAHLIAATKEKQAKAEKAGEASITYQGETGMGLDGTMYGQQVKLLDTTGILAATVGKRKPSLTAITSFE